MEKKIKKRCSCLQGAHAHPPPAQVPQGGLQMVLGEEDPLLDDSALLGVAAEQLVADSRVGGAIGQVVGDSVGLDQPEAIGALDRRDLAEWEAVEVVGRLVGGAHGEALGHGEGEASDGGGGEDLVRNTG